MGLISALVAVVHAQSEVTRPTTTPRSAAEVRHRMWAEGESQPPGATELSEPQPLPVPTEESTTSAVDLPEGPIDPEQYRVGPGDGLLVLVWGAAEVNAPVRIDPEGRIFIPSVGVVDFEGLSLAEARIRVREATSKVYSRVNVDLVLTTLRRFKVHVVGEGSVLYPGSYSATAVTRASEAIELAGGLSLNGSRRLIVMRTAEGEKHVDLVGFTLAGRLDANPTLLDGAVLEVPKRSSSVLLSGSVLNPGNYEPLPDERLSGMLAATGGLSPGADTTRVLFSRRVGPGASEEQEFAYVPGSGTDADPILHDGDRVYIRALPNWGRDAEVFVYGAVERAGRYPIPLDGQRLSVVIERAGGVTRLANLHQAHVIRVRQRYTEAPMRPEFTDYAIDPSQYDFADVQANIDSLFVRCDLEGLLVKKDASKDLVLYNGDIVRVPEDRHEVRVLGRVRAPGSYAFREGTSAGDYIAIAGGFDKDADKKRTSVAPFDGAPLRKIDGGGAVASGSIVYVPTKDRISTWQRTREALGFVVQVASLVVIVDRFTHD